MTRLNKATGSGDYTLVYQGDRDVPRENRRDKISVPRVEMEPVNARRGRSMPTRAKHAEGARRGKLNLEIGAQDATRIS
jgi:hypothetical protein